MTNTTLEELRLGEARRAPDGKQIMTLEEYLGMCLKHPAGEYETLMANASCVLRTLGILVNGQEGLVKRTAAWLRANGYRSVQRQKVFKVTVVRVPECPVHVV